jgi:hypothetical protein
VPFFFVFYVLCALAAGLAPCHYCMGRACVGMARDCHGHGISCGICRVSETLGLGLVQRAERADKSAAEGGGEWGIYKQKDMGCYDCDATVRVVES